MAMEMGKASAKLEDGVGKSATTKRQRAASFGKIANDQPAANAHAAALAQADAAGRTDAASDGYEISRAPNGCPLNAALNGEHASRDRRIAAARDDGMPKSAQNILCKDGEHVFQRPRATACIQFAKHNGRWVAEFRFALRSGLFQACTLPLTTSSEHHSTKALAVASAARRLIASAHAAVADAELNKSQQAALEGLVEWASGLAQAAELQPPSEREKPLAGLRFLDVFAGIGGFHIALESQGAKCAGMVELDPDSRETYRRNHPGPYAEHDDVRTVDPSMFGRVDIVCGGFPCQSFSVAGDREGLAAPDKGSLFFDLARLIGALAPSIAILENVAGLCDHDGGKTFDTVLDTLTGLGYSVSTRLLNASHFGLPQMRERLFLVCAHESVLMNRVTPFQFPSGGDATRVVADILERSANVAPCSRGMERLRRTPQGRSTRIETVGLIEGRDSQGYRVASARGKGFTLCANSGGLGRNSGSYLVGRTIRRLSVRECARMQGFPELFKPHPVEGKALKQIGNSVAVPVAKALAKSIAALLLSSQSAPSRLSRSGHEGGQERGGSTDAGHRRHGRRHAPGSASHHQARALRLTGWTSAIPRPRPLGRLGLVAYLATSPRLLAASAELALTAPPLRRSPLQGH